MVQIHSRTCADWSRSRPLNQTLIASLAIGGGVIVILGTCLSWFSLFAGLKPFRGLDVLNGRLLAGAAVFSILAGLWFFRRGGLALRWGIGLLGFALLAFASWSLFQLLIMYRQLSADPMMLAKLGPGLIFVVVGSLLIFATLFLRDE
jgi:hypothetical protein